MIWQLLKRDRPWRTGVLFCVVVPILIVVAGIWMDLPPRVTSRAAFRGDLAVFLPMETAIIVLFGFPVYAARDLYEAALPLDGRDIWFSRLLSMVSLAWLPVPIAIAGGLPALTLVAGASVITFVILCVKCFRVRELGTPKVFRAASQAVMVGIACVIIFGRALRSVHWPEMPSASSVFTVCGLASLFLFSYGSRSVPRSFVIATVDSDRPATEKADRHRKPALTPIFRSIYTFVNMFLLFGIVIAEYGRVGIAILAVIPLQSVFANSRWLLALPFSRRWLFALIAAAPTVAVAAGSSAAALLGRGDLHTVQERAIDFAVQLGCVYFAMFLLALPGWRPLFRVRAWVKWIPFGVAFFAISSLSFSTLPLWIAHIGSPNLWLLIFLAPASMYWLAEKAFVEQEYRRPLVQSQQRSASL